jgi:hypothetical protein
MQTGLAGFIKTYQVFQVVDQSSSIFLSLDISPPFGIYLQKSNRGSIFQKIVASPGGDMFFVGRFKIRYGVGTAGNVPISAYQSPRSIPVEVSPAETVTSMNE